MEIKIEKTNKKEDILKVKKLSDKLYRKKYVSFRFPLKMFEKATHLYVAKDRNKVVGYAVVYTPNEAKEVYGYTKPEEYNIKTVGKFLQGGQIGIDPNYFKEGIGTLLVKKIEEDALKEGYDSLYVKIAESNVGSIKFNEKMGFKKIAEKIEKVHGKEEVTGLYEKKYRV